MGEQAQCLDRGDIRGPLAQGQAQQFAGFFIAIKEHVLLAGEVVEYRHPPDVGRCRDVVHGHMIEAPLEEQARGGIGDALPRGEAFAGAKIDWD